MRWRRQATMNSRAMRPGSMRNNAGEQILPLHAGKHQQHGGYAGQNQGRAQIGLLYDQEDKNHGHDDGAQQGLLQIAHLVEPGMQEPGQKQHQNRLGDLRGLKGEVPSKANPAMGVVRAGNKEHQQRAAAW